MKLKLTAMALLLAMLLSVLVGCGKPADTTTEAKPGGNDPADNGETTKIPEGFDALVTDGKIDYQIVYPIGENSAQTYAEQLAADIEDATGVAVTVGNDSKLKNSDHEIRIGKVGRMDALSFYNTYNSLGMQDFVIKAQDGHLYIYTKGSGALKTAMEYFYKELAYFSLEDKYAGIKSEIDVLYTEPKVPVIEYTGSDQNYLYFSLNAGTLNESFARISFTGNKAWRLQTKSKNEEFNDIGASQRLSLSLGEDPVLTLEEITVNKTENGAEAVASDGSKVVLVTSPFTLTFYTPPTPDTPDGSVAAEITNLSTSFGGSSISGTINPNEAIYGTGERFDSVNQRGKKIHMFTKDIWSRADACYMVIPLLCFTRGSGIFLNIYEEMNLDLGASGKIDREDTWTANVVGANIDCYFYTSEQMSDAIYGYSLLSGFAEVPEEWTYGMIICRYGPDLSQKWGVDISAGEKHDAREMGVYDCIAMMEAYDLPWTGILAEGWGPDNASKYKDLKELCNYVHSLGKKFLVYMRVGYVSEHQMGYQSPYALTMTKPNGTTTNRLPAAESNNPDTGGANNAAYPYLDVTNPNAVEWFFGEYWDFLANDIGVDGCKIDFCETVPEYYELNYYDENQPTSGSHHWLPTAFCAMFGEMISSKPDSGMNYTRGGGIGSQRAPYMWAGDQKRCYESLEFQLRAVLSSGMSGVPFMSYDMSGYQYGNASQDPYYEGQVFVRGLQFTAFTICMQQHGKVRNAFEFANGDVKMEFKNNDWVKVTKKDSSGNPIIAKDSSGNNIQAEDSFGNKLYDKNGNPIWEYEYVYEIKPGQMTYITDIYRGYLKLHELLTPYITEYSEIACTTGMPVMRILALQWQNDVNVYDIQDEYMFGDAFLVAPVLDNTFKRDIYLPEGEWTDLNTGRTYTVGAEGMWLRNYNVRLQDLPVFYNENNESETAADLLPGIQEIFTYLGRIDCSQHIVK